MSEDWDTLVLLDACRYDTFSDVSTLNGNLQSVQSKGSWSWEFMEENFEGRDLHDTVYVTANPYAEDLSHDIFHTIESVLSEWKDDLGTVLPADVTQAAIEASETYPNKRLIVHYMQPHQPWIGPTADAICERAEVSGWMHNRVEGDHGRGEFGLVRDGVISHDEMEQAYQESLEITLDHVQQLLDTVPGRSVVTADHAELLGERIIPLTRRRYGHPMNLKCKTLRRVPWLEIPSETRRDVSPDPPVESTMTLESREDRLTALGYLDD
ncbi:hypothetical protein [Halorubrum sp. CSM-61]|uniref:hypothetical protein n=1 Tax=Halorubrum sp. CSM-61 TaxID=2485838 RepID=UPI000F4B5142|nr:hypothetical protein [Halorubrum sp. CSM-61]